MREVTPADLVWPWMSQITMYIRECMNIMTSLFRLYSVNVSWCAIRPAAFIKSVWRRWDNIWQRTRFSSSRFHCLLSSTPPCGRSKGKGKMRKWVGVGVGVYLFTWHLYSHNLSWIWRIIIYGIIMIIFPFDEKDDYLIISYSHILSIETTDGQYWNKMNISGVWCWGCIILLHPPPNATPQNLSWIFHYNPSALYNRLLQMKLACFSELISWDFNLSPFKSNLSGRVSQ